MIAMTNLAEVIVNEFHSKMTKREVKNIIKERCLYSSTKIDGAYPIDLQKVWNIILMNDANCIDILEHWGITDVIGLESWYEERCYQIMHVSAKLSYKRPSHGHF